MLPAFRATAGAEVVAICASSPERSRHLALTEGIPRPIPDYQQLCDLDGLDLICVASPNVHHFEHVSRALGTGRAVLAEKPLALTVEHIEELCRLQGQGSRPFAIVDHQLRYNPSLRRVRDLVRDGAIGRPYLVRLHQQSYVHPGPDAPWSWSFDAGAGGGTRLAIGSHLLDLLWFWFGRRPVYGVAGALDVIRSQRVDADGIVRDVSACDSFAAQLSLGGGLVVQLSASNVAVGGIRFDVEVLGSHGELRFDVDAGLRTFGTAADTRPHPAARDRTAIFSPSFVYLADAMVESLRTGDAGPLADASTFGDALATQRVLDAIAASSTNLELARIDDGYHPRVVV